MPPFSSKAAPGPGYGDVVVSSFQEALASAKPWCKPWFQAAYRVEFIMKALILGTLLLANAVMPQSGRQLLDEAITQSAAVPPHPHRYERSARHDGL